MKAVVMAGDVREVVETPVQPAGYEHVVTPVAAVHLAMAGDGWRIPEPAHVEVDLAEGNLVCTWRLRPHMLAVVPDGVDSLRGRLLQALERGGVPPEALGRLTEDVIGALDAWLLGDAVPDPAPVRSPQDTRGVLHAHDHR